MKRVCLTIDGRAVSGVKGQTLLHVAHRNGITIPTLCNFPGLAPAGACRVCIVEVDGYPRPLPACATTAEEGMSVATDSPRLHSARRHIIELLLAERNHQCPVCVMNNKCELQQLARQFGIDHLRYLPPAPHLEVDISHPRFGIDHNRCIMCRRCQRVCDEIEGAHTWDVGGRGAGSRIVSDLAHPWGESLTCTDCGKCVRICPTGALFEKDVEGTGKGGIDLERLMGWRGRRRR